MLCGKQSRIQSEGHSALAAMDTGKVRVRLFQHSASGKRALPVAFYIGGQGWVWEEWL